MFIDYQQTPLGREEHKKVVRIVHNLLDMKQSIIFRKPVCYRALGLDDYKDIVKKPIDLNMIRRLNNEWKYKYVEEVFDDIMLCWNNCRVYNKPGSEIYEAAVEMEQNFVQQVLQQYPDYKIPDGIIRGREPFIMPIPSLLTAPTIEKVERPIQSNPYDRRYDRPMNSRSKVLEKPQRSLRQENRIQEGKQSAHEMSESMPIEIAEQKLSSQQQIKKKSKKTESNEQPMVPEEPQPVEQHMQIEEQPHQPIIIQLPQKPSLENIINLSEKVKMIRDKTVLRGIVKIIMDMEPECSSVEQHTYRFNASAIRMNTYIRLEEYLESRIK